MTTAVIAFGGNLGDSRSVYGKLLDLLHQDRDLANIRASRLCQTRPVGGPAKQGDYLNAAMALTTGLPAEALHQRLSELETRLGRERRVHWDERVIDLDLVLYGSAVIDTPELTVPHPRMHFRRFVLAPASAVAPDLVHPVIGKSVRDLLQSVERAHESPHLAVRFLGDAKDRRGAPTCEDRLAVVGVATLAARIVAVELFDDGTQSLAADSLLVATTDLSSVRPRRDREATVRVAVVDARAGDDVGRDEHIRHFWESIEPVVAICSSKVT